jgi:membrane-associated protein
MSISTLTELLLAAVVAYGAVVLALVFLAAAAGLPVPSTLFVIAGGAFIQQGVLAPVWTIGAGMAGVILGDMLSYGIGRLLRGPIQRRYAQSPLWLRGEAAFARQAPLAILLTRFLLTPIAVPVNLIAGGSAYPPARFALYAAGGELIWLLGYGTLGYLFASQWAYVSTLVSSAGGWLVGLGVVAVVVSALWRRRPAAPQGPVGRPSARGSLAAVR